MPNKTYSDLLHDSAARWGYPVPTERPPIDDDTSPYPHRLPVVETLQMHGADARVRAEIELVELAGQWSFAGRFFTPDLGCSFPPCMKFCDPVRTRGDALAAAILWLRSYKLPAALIAWLDELEQAKQLSLF